MRYLILPCLILLVQFLHSQPLIPERIKRIKDATVRITIDSSNSVGTGFFIDESGVLLTCWHVIEPALKQNSINKIFIQLNSGEKVEAFLPNFPPEFIKKSVVFDFAYLIVDNKQNKKFQFLKMGSYSELKEGEEIYTCGYPLGITQQFISQGIVSTKYTDTITYLVNNKPVDKHIRQQTLLDLTLNKGNSGGAIIKLGQTPEDDAVIGIADFIIIPYGEIVESLNKVSGESQSDIAINGISTMGVYQIFSGALAQASNGISGCVSIEHFLEAFENTKKVNK